MNKPNLKAGALVVAGIMSVAATHTRADAIAIQNYSFEVGSPSNSNIPADFTASGGIGRSFTRPSVDNYGVVTNNGSYYVEINNNYGNGSYVSQTTAYTANAGDTFTLSSEIGDSGYNKASLSANDFVGSLELIIGGTVVATNTLADTETPVTGTFDATEDLTYTATAADAGESVGVELLNPNNTGSGPQTVIYFDDLQLNVTNAPEPSIWAMMLGGLLALVGLGRITRKES